VIKDYQIPIIHYLKIDAEGAELKILQGINDSDWPKIQQVAMEVHDYHGRKNDVIKLLTDKGFQIKDDSIDDSPDRVGYVLTMIQHSLIVGIRPKKK